MVKSLLKIYSVTYGTIDASVIVNFLSYNLLTDFLLWDSHKKTKTKRFTHKITYKTTLRYAYKWYDRYFCFDYQNGQQNESCVQVLATFQVT